MENNDLPPRNIPQRVKSANHRPFKKREKFIAIDATGFSTETYACWRNRKPEIQKSEHRNWLKLHAAVTSSAKVYP